MPHRFVLHEALQSLNNGHHLIKYGEVSYSHYLEGCPDISVIINKLIHQQYVKPIDDNESRYVITNKGRKVFEEGHQLYKRMPLWKRILGQTKLFSFDWH